MAHLLLANALSGAGDKLKAIEAYRRAAELDEGGEVEGLAEDAILKLKDAR